MSQHSSEDLVAEHQHLLELEVLRVYQLLADLTEAAVEEELQLTYYSTKQSLTGVQCCCALQQRYPLVQHRNCLLLGLERSHVSRIDLLGPRITCLKPAS
jgi:hypothetical protein